MKLLAMNILQITVPKDIPLDMPLPYWLLVALLIFSFLLHILFVNLMIGGTALTLWAQIRGLKNKKFNELAIEIEKTVTVNKSLAVVLGVAPLLSINVLYTVYFYSANALTGLMWISIIPFVIVAFLLGYLHKYTWDRLKSNPSLHIAIISAATLIYFFVPFIFLTNINLMQFPDKWGTVEGFFSAMTMSNVFPRYLHFITASFAITGLFVFWYFGRKQYEFSEKIKGFTIYELRKKALSLVFFASLIQFVFGPLLFLTLPQAGISWNLFLYIGIGVLFAILALVWMWSSLTGPEENLSKRFWPIVAALTITVIFMGIGRQVYRSNALSPHEKLMAEKTEQYLELVEEARIAGEQGLAKEVVELSDQGEILFNQNCAVCHQPDSRLVGPSVSEIIPLYRDDKDTLIAWIKKPERKREDYPPMPAFPQLKDEELEQIATYLLEQ